ncbi:hypothetical protein MKX01_027041 [Papaver californicum]|nr:hypothetical protein MKX01_027041 [Papaver californicum]
MHTKNSDRQWKYIQIRIKYYLIGKPISIVTALESITKENRAAGILENFEEGEKYAEHEFRKFIRGHRPEIMPSLKNFFTDPKI